MSMRRIAVVLSLAACWGPTGPPTPASLCTTSECAASPCTAGCVYTAPNSGAATKCPAPLTATIDQGSVSGCAGWCDRVYARPDAGGFFGCVRLTGSACEDVMRGDTAVGFICPTGYQCQGWSSDVLLEGGVCPPDLEAPIDESTIIDASIFDFAHPLE